MLFNSYQFILLFLPFTFFVYFFLTKNRLFVAARSFLAAASLFFYSVWNVAYLPLILTSMIVNFSIGSALASGGGGRRIPVNRKAVLVAGIGFNLALLGYFKYANFFIDNAGLLFSGEFSSLDIVLPLAISFYTFQQIAYLVDSYKGETREYDFLSYVVFVTFFPQLIAGPIVHHREMMPQFSSRWNMLKRYRNIAVGLVIFGIGLFKKVVIADWFAQTASYGFDQAEALSLVEGWATSLSYTFQIYFDFSGYTDMAVGLALLFNIRLPQNFNSPYKATSIQDFWRRWHMTLSRFLRDYLYIPLGGNRRGHVRTGLNILITFILGGLWYGASWMFVIWGGLHGAALVVHRLWQGVPVHIPRVLAWLLTFNFINITWVFFRAEDMDSALRVLCAMVDIGSLLPEGAFMAGTKPWMLAAAIVLALFTVLCAKNTIWVQSALYKNARARWIGFIYFGAGIIWAVALFMLGYIGKSEFLYFNF